MSDTGDVDINALIREHLPPEEAELSILVSETYAPEGRQIWWDTYRKADDAGKKRLALHLKLGAEGACS